MSLTGHVQNGVVVFETSNALPDGTAVKVEAIEAPPKLPKRSLLDRLGDVVGKAEGLPADASQNVDHTSTGIPRNEGCLRFFVPFVQRLGASACGCV
jgi:hypothetical protein